ncbi:hypothetical protein Tco_1172495 [Tanacetum coccineum]
MGVREMNGKDPSKQVALDLVHSPGVRRRRSQEKEVALIRFIWRVKENSRSRWLCFLDRWKSALKTRLSKDVSGCDVMITEDGRGGGHLVFLIGGRISVNSIDRQRCGCQDKKRIKKKHGVNIMAVEVQIGWLWTWSGRRSWVRDKSGWCKKTVECVACLLGRWNGSRGTGMIGKGLLLHDCSP